MKNKPLVFKQGFAVVETLLIITIVVLIIVFFSQRYYPQTGYYFTNGYRTTTIGGTNTLNVPTNSSSSYSTTTTQTPTIINTSANETPIITLYGDNPYTIFHPGTVPVCEGNCPPRTDVYVEPGFRAYDKEDGDITSRVKVTDESRKINSNEPCTQYNKKYSVTDSNGNTTTTTRTIKECNGL